jgi:2-polyprenyl-6-methoxyphenol hydroxylase-like FAD-dependent oxidoreductase
MTTTPYRWVGPDFIFTVGCNGANSKFRSHAMPNSLVTFNRFWNSAKVGSGAVDQPALLNAFDQLHGGGGEPATLDCAP